MSARKPIVALGHRLSPSMVDCLDSLARNDRWEWATFSSRESPLRAFRVLEKINACVEVLACVVA